MVSSETEDSDKKDFIELGWYMLRKQNDKPRLVINPKQKIETSFPIEREAGGQTMEEFLADVQWQNFVAKALPEEAFT